MAFKGGAGKLDRLITFQRLPAATETPDSFGEITGDPVNDLRNVKAAYEPAGALSSGGGEFPESEKRQAQTTAKFRIRYRAEINVQTVVETHQIVYVEDHKATAAQKVTRTYDIKHAEVVGRREEILLEVEEVR